MSPPVFSSGRRRCCPGYDKETATKLKDPRNTIVASVVLVFGLLLLFVLIPAGIGESPYGEMDERVGPTYFPSVIAVGMMVTGLALLLISLTGREPSVVDTNVSPHVLQGMGLIIGYYLLFLFFGYRIATILSLAGFFWAFGERKLATLAIVPLVVAFGFKWVFEGVFNIRLHEGILF